MSEYKSDPMTDGRGMLSAFLMAIITFPIIMYFINSSRQDNFDKFRTSKNIYCPSSYKLVKGDGVFSHDRSSPLTRAKTNIVHQKDWYLYDDKGNAFHYNECVIRGK